MNPTVRSAALVSVLAAALALPAAALAQAMQTDPAFATTTLSLSATGETDATPDQAVITLGVQTRAAGAGAAMAENAHRMNAVIGALRAAGIAEKDIRTSNLSLGAQYDYPQGQPAHLNGYQASNDVTVTVNALDRLGPVIDAVTSAGANQINGVAFGLKSPRTAEDAARLEAVKSLRAKAELYAQASGYHIVRLVSLSEGFPEGYPPIRPVAMARSVVQGVPVSAGQLTVQVSVNAVFELAK
jgi:uncharacterized protein YggE